MVIFAICGAVNQKMYIVINMKRIDSYIIEKLHLNKDIKIKSNSIYKSIDEIVTSYFKKVTSRKFQYHVAELEKDWLRLEFYFEKDTPEKMLDGWCYELCDELQEKLDGYFWSSRSTSSSSSRPGVFKLNFLIKKLNSTKYRTK